MVPPGRKKRLAKNAKPTSISLTPVEGLVLQTIEARRRERSEERDSPSEIVADALWHYIITVEQVPKEQIEALVPAKPDVQNESNLKPFPKR
jgi:hypothetical protein